jgi:hypothetical protein
MAGANPELVVRVAANLAELKKNMAEGVSQIETTTAAMGKLAASFSGDKIIQAAHNVVAAVNEIGGASKLTEANQARVNATLEKALEQYRVLGKDAPPGMQKLADETRQVDKASTGLTDTVKSLALGFAAMFSARAAFNFVKDTINEASALNDLSQQTHIGVEDIQLLAGAMSEFGVDADTLAKGVFSLSRRIAGGDESATHALALMGMSLKDVEGLQGKDLFLKMESGLATLQGSLRDTAASDLFGSKLGMAMAGASEGIGGAMAKAQALNTVMSGESVRAMDEYGESIERTQKSMSAMAGNMIGPLAQGFNVIYDATTKGASKLAIFWAMAQDEMDRAAGAPSGLHLLKLLDDINIKTEAGIAATKQAAAAHGDVAAAVDTRTKAEQFMAVLEANAAGVLNTTQLADLAHLKEIGALNAANALGIGVNAAQFAKYTAGIEAAKKATSDLADAQKAADALIMTTYQGQLAALRAMETARAKSYGTREQIAMLGRQEAAEQALAAAVYAQLNSEKERMTLIEAGGKRHAEITAQKMALEAKLTAVIGEAILAELQAQVKLNAAWGLDAVGALKAQGSAAETLRLGLEKLQATEQAGVSQKAQTQLLYDAYTKSLYDEATASDAARDGLDTVGKSLGAIPPLVQAAGSAMLGLIDSMKDYKQFGQEGWFGWAPTGAMPTIISLPSTPGLTTAPTNPGGTWTPPRRASGGPVASRSPYLVGERGPELFVPASAGAIVPHGGGGIALTQHIYVTQPLGTPQAIASAVGDAHLQGLKNLGVRLPTGV